MLKKIINHRRSRRGGQAVTDYALVFSFIVITCVSMLTILSASLRVQLDPLEQTYTKLPSDPAVF